MKKKLLCGFLATAMAFSLAACGSTAPAGEATTDGEATEGEATEVAADGTVLNIRCWNDEFQTRVKDYYPGYEEVDPTHGKIGDIEVVWDITPSKENAYQNALDTALQAQADAAANDKVDLFLVEADYALKYVNTDFVMPIADLGITDDELAEQFQYTKDIMTDSNGVLKGVSWQGCPCVMFYNREIATEVLGSDDPETVQAAVSDWAAFKATADKVKAAGYMMTSSANDSYRVYSNNVSQPWVTDGVITIDDNINKWVEDSKAMVDAKETETYDLWSDDWAKGFMQDSKVFCYFGPAWFVNFSMHCDEEGSVGIDGGWAACVGPQSSFWGGTWICAATGTDNADLVADIMRVLTTDAETMKKIVVEKDDFVNNKAAMDEMAASDYTSDILGGQNPLPLYIEGAAKIDMSKQSAYDQGCNESFQNAMKNYFNGSATLEEATELFYTTVGEMYPELTH